MSKIIVSPLAQADIDEIWDYIARDSLVNADRFIDRLERRFGLLAANPRLGLRATIFGRACAASVMSGT